MINTSTVSSNSCFDRRIFPACDHDGDGGGLRAALRYTALESVVTSAGEDGRLSRMLLPGGRSVTERSLKDHRERRIGSRKDH